MGKTISTTMRIEKIQKVKTQTKNLDTEMYRLIGKDSDGVGTVVISMPSEFDGLKPNEVIDIKITSSQTSLKEFEKVVDKKKEKKEEPKKKPTSIPMPK
jgi:hypothetical protein